MVYEMSWRMLYCILVILLTEMILEENGWEIIRRSGVEVHGRSDTGES
jgi:hypothetical protein